MQMIFVFLLIAMSMAEAAPSTTPINGTVVDPKSIAIKPSNATNATVAAKPQEKKEKKGKKEVDLKKQRKEKEEEVQRRAVKRYKKALRHELVQLSLSDTPKHNRLYKLEKRYFKLNKQTNNLKNRFHDEHSTTLL